MMDRSTYSTKATGLSLANGKYLLPSDEAELKRLELQHKMLKRDFNNNQLLPSELHLSDHDRILDAGTGTGAWAMDVAADLSPSFHVVATDVQDRLFPNAHPENITFSVCSITSLPSDWSATFTVVHERLLISALSMDDWKKALSELFRVLKPGGWSLLEEIDMLQVDLEGVKPDPPITRKFRQALRDLAISHGISGPGEAVLKLSDMVRDAGFEDLCVKWKNLPCGPGNRGRDTTAAFTGSSAGFKKAMLARGGFGFATTEEGFDRAMAEVVEEWEKVGIETKFLSWTARKPESQRA